MRQVLVAAFQVLLISINVERVNGHRIFPTSPEHVGLAHTLIIQNLMQKFEINPPQNSLEYLHAVSTEMRKISCEPKDPDCNSRIVRRTMEIKPDQYDEVTNILPKNFEPDVAEAIFNLYDITELVDIDDPSKVLNYMNEKKESLFNRENINESDRLVGLLTFSVGMESTKQWAEVVTDPKNPFHLIATKQREGDRKLQMIDTSDPEIQLKFVNMLQADISGAISGAIEGIGGGMAENTMMGKAIEDASIASLKSFMLNFVAPPSISTIVNSECDFPDAFWCDDGDIIVPGGDGACLFPGSSLCDENNENSILPPIDPCIIPNNPLCDGQKNTTQPVRPPLPPINPCLIPNNPLCAENNNSSSTVVLPPFDPCIIPNHPLCDRNNTVAPNRPPINDIDPCVVTPNAPMCVASESSNTGPPGCPFPGSPLCNQLDQAVNNIGDPCLLYPNLPMCRPNQSTDIVSTPLMIPFDESRPLPSSSESNSLSTNMKDTSLQKDFNNAPSSSNTEESIDPLCVQFPTLPSCQSSNINNSINDLHQGSDSEVLESISYNDSSEIANKGEAENISNGQSIGSESESNNVVLDIFQDGLEMGTSNNVLNAIENTNENAENLDEEEKVKANGITNTPTILIFTDDDLGEVESNNDESSNSSLIESILENVHTTGYFNDENTDLMDENETIEVNEVTNTPKILTFVDDVQEEVVTSNKDESTNSSLIESVLGNVANTVEKIDEDAEILDEVEKNMCDQFPNMPICNDIAHNVTESETEIESEIDSKEYYAVDKIENDQDQVPVDAEGGEPDLCDQFPNLPMCLMNSGAPADIQFTPPSQVNDELASTEFFSGNNTNALPASPEELIENVLNSTANGISTTGNSLIDSVLNNATDVLNEAGNIIDSVFGGNFGGVVPPTTSSSSSSSSSISSNSKPQTKPCFFGLCLTKTSNSTETKP